MVKRKGCLFQARAIGIRSVHMLPHPGILALAHCCRSHVASCLSCHMVLLGSEQRVAWQLELYRAGCCRAASLSPPCSSMASSSSWGEGGSWEEGLPPTCLLYVGLHAGIQHQALHHKFHICSVLLLLPGSWGQQKGKGKGYKGKGQALGWRWRGHGGVGLGLKESQQPLYFKTKH